MSDQETLDRLFTGLGAAQEDMENGTRIAQLFKEEGPLPESFGLFGIDQDVLKEKGLKLWNGVSGDLHKVFCDPKSEYHSIVAAMIKTGSTGIGTALAGVIVASMGAAIPILASATVAGFVARLVIQFFVTQGYDLGCGAWGDSLKPKEAPKEPPAVVKPAG
jgi:hypothetical protein